MIRGLITLIALGVLALPQAALAANEVFTVRNVPVDATAEGAAQAREVAIANGQRVAFQRLMERLTRRQDWNAVPSVDSTRLANLALGFAVAQERSSSTRYLAKVTYSFKPASIREFLRQAGIPFSEARAKPALLLAVLQTQDGIALWEEPNPWRAAWAKRDLADDLVPILAPLNDLGDAALISADQANAAGWPQVAGIAQKYGLDRVIVASASASPGGLNVKLRQLSATQDTSTQFSFAGGGDLDAALDQAVDSALARLYDEWKSATIVDFGQESSIIASIWFNTLQEWLTIRRRLDEAPTVTSIDVLGLSSRGAQVRLRHAGTTDQLKITLEQISLTLSNQGAYWVIAMAESVGFSPAPRAPKQGGVIWPTEGGAPGALAPRDGAPSPRSSTAPITGGVDSNLIITMPPPRP